MDIEATVLEGDTVRLEPLASRHLSELAIAIRDGNLWELPVTFVPHPDDLPRFLIDAETAYSNRRELAFATVDKKSERVVGSTRFMEIDITNRSLEIGFTFVAAAFQRSHVNSEAKYLMLRHAFEHWKCHRVSLLTDVRNEKSRRAIARLGAKEEGVMRRHLVMRDGWVRDSVLFAIVDLDWPEVKAALEARFA